LFSPAFALASHAYVHPLDEQIPLALSDRVPHAFVIGLKSSSVWSFPLYASRRMHWLIYRQLH
jgi:hypothetical protein